MKFVVVQKGARRAYAIPSILNDYGMLQRFYTDICGNIGIGRIARYLTWVPHVGAMAKRLSARTIPKSVAEATRVPFVSIILNIACALLMGDSVRNPHLRDASEKRRWGAWLKSASIAGATHVYAMFTECGDYVAYARERGLVVVSEVYILLSTDRIIEAEARQFPEWATATPAEQTAEYRAAINEHMLRYSDYFICPSKAVKRDLVANFGVKASRCFVVPYGVSAGWLELRPEPVRGRVLFVGTADIRKGIHYLAAAANILADRARTYEFVVVGSAPAKIMKRPECRNLRFVGHLAIPDLKEEFRVSDVFVLPSLCEGSAEASYEALAAGLPLVVTEAVGSVARDGVEGRIIPPRDALSLANALEEIIENRNLRNQMGAAARARARAYLWPRYGRRLVRALIRTDASGQRNNMLAQR